MTGERGSMAPLLALVVVLAGAACLVLGRLGGVATATARAQTAADAAALAGAADGSAAARSLARANGARVARLDVAGDDVEVAVVVGQDVAAVARARSGDGGWPGAAGAGAGGRVGLDPALVEAIRRAETLVGAPVPITSGWRSRAEQQRLHADRGSNPYPVARPGTSAHERGGAIDVPRAFAERLAAVAPRAGLCRPWPHSDPIHFELCRTTR